MRVVTPGRGLVPGRGSRRIPTHPAFLPRSEPLPRVPPEAVCWRGWRRETACSPIAVTPPGCFQSACSRAPSPSLPPVVFPHRLAAGARGSQALAAAREGAGREGAGGAGSGGRRRQRGYVVPRPPGSTRARARARRAELGRRAAGGAAGGGRRSSRPSGWSERRAERGVGGRARAGGLASSVSTSICRGRVCPKRVDRPADRSPGGRTRALAWSSGPASARLWACSAGLPLLLAATQAPAASVCQGLEVREPRSAGWFPRGSARAAVPRPRVASSSPRCRPGCSEHRCSGAPNSGCRGKCLHEPRGCPGSTTRVLKSVVASNISYLASMSYFG